MKMQKTISPRVVVIGGGSAGIGVIASLKKRIKNLTVILIEPRDQHDYQPAWTLVGAGLFDPAKTRRPLNRVIPPQVTWVKDLVAQVHPDKKYLETSTGKRVTYDYLIVACGLIVRWDSIVGLEDTLGQNGVTSNYRSDLACYTWHLVKHLKQGRAIFTQPSAPIKCAGAPQKTLYLSSDYWLRQGCLKHIDVAFCLAGQTVFGVPEFVTPLTRYLEKYNAQVLYAHTLISVDGERQRATFTVTADSKETQEVTLPFDMLHVVPPQSPPNFIEKSGLADNNGWCDVDHYSLQHLRWSSIFSLGDCCSTPNSKTAAAVRKQIVVVANNLAAVMNGKEPNSHYDGYGACPLTVEKGKVMLAEFGYENRLMPSFLINPTSPSRFNWWLNRWFLPRFYWAGMLRGVEWFTKNKK
ncbi:MULTISPECIES: FAD/NAD(P)-binding oxidoreductase [Serratia]|uniref:NAD(P)/FAD-dependent oxidoreductase n=1 Tax=Serratia TaxID=613 RepID=UPI001F4C1159|nr:MULTISPECIES: FAD/NAD(P)-binding oxidoreductase [Serratia]ULG11030.1 pyridine nucleotide-disulfide oxidoreductase [Serratia entomophila]CAI1954410.1 Sulfide dehydrogenase [flavocytochrome c] flavoprotein chain precursor [Serratia quinivorans]CAI2159077.1 Sulfide dehydrogenase [flavocytochrome c] flavoprotein chain precursor [Serratia quinivorans]